MFAAKLNANTLRLVYVILSIHEIFINIFIYSNTITNTIPQIYIHTNSQMANEWVYGLDFK